ncbi:MAG: hypothetical protein ACKOOH_11795 [Cyanobium sp.]
MRGGSWFNEPHNCRSAYRNSNHPDNLNNNVGFRVCSFPPAPFIARTVGWESSGRARGVQTRSRDSCFAAGIRTAPVGGRPGQRLGPAPLFLLPYSQSAAYGPLRRLSTQR